MKVILEPFFLVSNTTLNFQNFRLPNALIKKDNTIINSALDTVANLGYLTIQFSKNLKRYLLIYILRVSVFG